MSGPLEHLPPPADDAGGPDSPLTTLRARRMQLHAETTKRFPIPGFGGELVCEYRVMPREEFKAIERRNVRKAGDKPIELFELDAYADELIAACVGFYVKVDGELEPADAERPVRYDGRLADALGYGPVKSAREALRGLFVLGSGEQRASWALDRHHTEVFAWVAGNPEDPEDEGAQGEAEAAFEGE